MAITFDGAKRAWTLRERGLDFIAADEVFKGSVYEEEDTRGTTGRPGS